MAEALSPKLNRLLGGLVSLRIRRNAQLATLALAWGLTVAAACLLLASLGDAAAHFSVALRLTSFCIVLLVLLLALAVAVRLLLRRFSHQALAAIVEHTCPDADNAVINAVQLHEAGTADNAIIDAILDEHPLDVRSVKAHRTYPHRYVTRLAIALPVVAVAFVLAFALSDARMPIAFRRIVAPWADIPPFTETYITSVAPGNLTIRRGEGFTVTATLDGILPDATSIEWLIPATDAHELETMAATADNDTRLSFEFPPTFDSLKYRIISNDATTDWFRVTVDNPPGLENWEIKATPPEYTGLKTISFTAASETREIPGGSAVVFAGEASKELSDVTFLADKTPLSTFSNPAKPFKVFICEGRIPFAGILSVNLKTPANLQAGIPLPIAIIPDKLPAVVLHDTPTAMKVKKGDSVTVTFVATDDYGLATVSIEQLLSDGKTSEIAVATPKDAEKRHFQARFVVDTNSFNLDDNLLRLRLRAVETASTAPSRHGLSPVIAISFFSDKEAEQKKQAKSKENEETLERLLILQKNALKLTNDTMLKHIKGTPLDNAFISEAGSKQTDIRNLAIAILVNRDMLGALGDTLAGMVNKEFNEAIAAADALNQCLGQKNALDNLQKLAAIQTKIIALLTTLNKGAMAAEEQHQAKADIFALIQRLVKDQNVIIRLTTAAAKAPKPDIPAIARHQTNISKGLLAFNDKALASAEEHTQDDLSVQLRKAVQAIEDAKSYNHSMDAIEALEDDNDFENALKSQKLTLKGIADAYKILNDWRVNNAKKTIEKASETIAEVKDALKGLEERQAKIAEVARELMKRGPDEKDPSLKDDMEKIKKEHEEMLDMLEKLANDLYQFPDLPICNELNSKMREIFEDVLQAKDSEHLKAVEIAVQKEDAILDAIRSTTERIDDVEMWLMDVPDHFIWNMETFDSDEFPEMPLVELPEELQDIVGDLLDQDNEIDAQSQDTTSNNMVADAEMGWMVMDGNMPSFAAKGKTGNTRPNDNEMTGRSGAGREGQATGELVENHVKGYEGRETHARKTNDKFQKGQVTEDKDSTMKARATGGGKLGGDSEVQGMFGNAPRRDLHRGAHGTQPRQLRKETDVLFAKARLLYINSGSIGEAAHHLSGVGKNPPDLKSFDPIRKKVVRRLSDSVIEMQEGTVLPMPVDPVVRHNANDAEQRQGENVSDEYKTQLDNYYKSLNQ